MLQEFIDIFYKDTYVVCIVKCINGIFIASKTALLSKRGLRITSPCKALNSQFCDFKRVVHISKSLSSFRILNNSVFLFQICSAS